jgi:hypothetical protein
VGKCKKHFQEGSAELQIPPLRYASVGMTKGRATLPFRFDDAEDEQQVPPLRCAPVGMTLLFGVGMWVHPSDPFVLKDCAGEKEQQVPPLRYASVGMTLLFQIGMLVLNA